jgi:mannose-1-phosphate guanylyltransferase/mannose-6-phosphate isomerase
LWPLSTPDRPKQFLDLIGEPFLIQSLTRLDGMDGLGDAVVVTGTDQVSMVVEAAGKAGKALHRIVVEPEGRNTAPAIVAAALILDPEETMVVLPADHLIADRPGFIEGVTLASQHAESGALVTFGIEPTYPETGYGYIEVGEGVDGAFEVAAFSEKPDRSTAEAMIRSGGCLWNSGMFVFRAGALLDETRRLAPEIVETVAAALTEGDSGLAPLGPGFLDVPSVSIDVAIMERTESARVVPLDVGWSDIGSWKALWEASPHDEDHNVLIGDVRAIDVTWSYVYSSGRRVAVAGVEGVVVVETPDEVLVLGIDSSQKVKDLLGP